MAANGAMILMVMLWNGVEGGLFGGLSDKNFPIPSELACEGFPIVVRCPGTDVIEVASAQYGRHNAETCATDTSKMRNTNCNSPQAANIIATKCNNRTQCKLTVNDENFPDPCPGTYKYLQVSYRCLKYMFACPGTLTGIGSNTSFVTSMEGESGSWSKDPIYNPNHVFYVLSNQQSVQEYRSTQDFTSGEVPFRIFQLPSRLEGNGYAVYDGNIYYVKARSRSVLKFSFLANMRIREGSVPGQYQSDSTGRNRIDLAVDEKGLWATYSSGSDRLVISRMNKNTLQIEKTWRTTYSHSNTLHGFMICGVLYVVGSRSGEVDYMYNTNALSRNGKSISVGFDHNRPFSPNPVGLRSHIKPQRTFNAPSGLISRPRTFHSYNFSSLVYNPRDRLLYAWDASSSKAVFYNLHFANPNPVDAGKPVTTTPFSTPPPTQTSTTTRKTPALEETVSLTPLPPLTGKERPTLNEFCEETTRNGMQWPRTAAKMYATVQCPITEGALARWRCDEGSSKPEWAIDGPGMESCDQWLRGIKGGMRDGKIDPVTAIDLLSHDLHVITLQNEVVLDHEQVSEAAQLMKEAVMRVGRMTTSLTSTQAQGLVEDLTNSVYIITEDKTKPAWLAMGSKERHQAVNNILLSMEEGALILSDVLMKNPMTYESYTETKPGIVTYAHVKEPLNQEELTIAESSLGGVEIYVPGRDLLSNGGAVVVIAYDNLGDIVDASFDGGREEELWKIDSPLVSVAIGQSGHHVTLPSPLQIVMKSHQMSEQSRKKCVYWKYSRSTGGRWSDEGCQMKTANFSHTECSCDHVTSFAVLVNVAETFPSSWEHDLALDIVTWVGISVSLLCLAVCIITFTAFSNLQNDRNTIHKHLCISLFIAELIFLIGINQTSHPLACSIIAGLLHYAFLAAFMWMALEGFQLYVMLVEVFEGNSRWKWYYVTGYGIPAVIVGVSAAVDSSGYGTNTSCWLQVDSGFIWSFVGPVCVVIVCNLVFLAITVAKMYRHSRTYTDLSKINSLKASVRGASVLVCLLGITWAFGILWIWEGSPVVAYVFCVFNAFQGLFIFVFHCLTQRKVRLEYKRCFARLSCCSGPAQQSYVSNSMSFSKQYTSTRYSSGGHAPPLPPNNGNTQERLRRFWNDSLHGANPSQSATLSAQEVHTRSSMDHLRKQRHFEGREQPSVTQHRAITPSDVSFMNRDDEALHAMQGNPPDDVMEDAYDHLQTHRHGNEGEHHHMHCNTECSHVHHMKHPGGFPRPQPRSRTMNNIRSDPNDVRGQEKEDITLLRQQGMHRASTLANAAGVGEWGKRPCTPSRRFSQPTRMVADDVTCPYHGRSHEEGNCLLHHEHPARSGYRLYNDNMEKQVVDSLHPGQRRRRSLTSSESDDPVVNDLSASSSAGSKPPSVTGTIGSRPVMSTCQISEHCREECAKKNPELYSRQMLNGYRDEDDLEVERLTEPEQLAPYTEEIQRDSAFYQSLPDLDCSPGSNYSPLSSGCSPQIGEIPPLYHRRPTQTCGTEKGRYVPPVRNDFRSIGASVDTEEDVGVRLHAGGVGEGYYEPPINNYDHRRVPRNHDNPVDPSNRMMTCL